MDSLRTIRLGYAAYKEGGIKEFDTFDELKTYMREHPNENFIYKVAETDGVKVPKYFSVND